MKTVSNLNANVDLAIVLFKTSPCMSLKPYFDKGERQFRNGVLKSQMLLFLGGFKVLKTFL